MKRKHPISIENENECIVSSSQIEVKCDTSPTENKIQKVQSGVITQESKRRKTQEKIKCSLCRYETIRKYNFKRHLQWHEEQKSNEESSSKQEPGKSNH